MRTAKIIGFEQYTVYEDGRVYSDKRNKFLSLRMYGRSRRPYYRVTLYDGLGNHSNRSIHRLVAEAFIPNPNNKLVVNHKDNNPKNNDVSNLEWVTHSENTIHSFNETDRKKLHKKVLQVDKNSGVVIREFNSVGEASLNIGIHYTNISKVLSGNQKTAGGFFWKIVEESSDEVAI